MSLIEVQDLHVQIDVQTSAQIVVDTINHHVEYDRRRRSFGSDQRQIWLPLST